MSFSVDVVTQAVSGPKEERKERVLWANFENGDINGMEWTCFSSLALSARRPGNKRLNSLWELLAISHH